MLLYLDFQLVWIYMRLAESCQLCRMNRRSLLTVHY